MAYDANGVPDKIKVTTLDWVDATQYRVGNEFKLNDMFVARLGYYYDPSPAPNETINILFPSHTYHAVTTGFGFQKCKFAADFGFEYLFGDEREAKMAYGAEMPGTYQMDIMSIALSLTYKY
jgi:long-chain fatty acid transport protein